MLKCTSIAWVCVLMWCRAVQSAPRLRVAHDMVSPNLLTLPSNATSIRANIEDSFSCDGRQYGYYADVDNDCQLFHVCLPVTYANGRSQMFRWSFICPDETIFNQEMFTCTRSDESIDCDESPRFYNLNTNFGEHLSITSGNHVTDVDGDGDGESTLFPPESAEVASELTSSAEVAHVTHEPTIPIVPLYHRRIMKL